MLRLSSWHVVLLMWLWIRAQHCIALCIHYFHRMIARTKQVYGRHLFGLHGSFQDCFSDDLENMNFGHALMHAMSISPSVEEHEGRGTKSIDVLRVSQVLRREHLIDTP